MNHNQLILWLLDNPFYGIPVAILGSAILICLVELVIEWVSLHQSDEEEV